MRPVICIAPICSARVPLCLIGASGTGKSDTLIGFGTAAAEKGFRVRSPSRPGW